MKRALSLVSLLVAACDIPTGLPKLNPEFAVRLQSTTISTAQLLPSSVTAANGGFSVSVQPIVLGSDLAALCPHCAPFNGMVVPKPAFTAEISQALPLPTDVIGATLLSGTVRMAMTHNFGFDPLRPGGSQTGTITVTVRSGPTVLGSKAFSGATMAFASGTTITDSIAVSGVINQSPAVFVNITSPAGDPIAVNTSRSFSLTATPGTNVASAVQVRINNRQVSGQPVQVDLADVDRFIANRVQSGSLILELTNPYGVSGTMTLTINGTQVPIVKNVTVPAGDAAITIPLSKAELRSMLGRVITISTAGTVSAPDGVTIAPTSAFVIDPLLVLQMGPDA
jgi:hypothetical protein